MAKNMHNGRFNRKNGMFLCQFVCVHLQQKQQLKNPAQKWPHNSGFIFPDKFNL
jgi:hypothetical protein